MQENALQHNNNNNNNATQPLFVPYIKCGKKVKSSLWKRGLDLLFTQLGNAGATFEDKC